jgi:hypothetical protein
LNHAPTDQGIHHIHAPPIPVYLSERMKVARMLEALQQMRFDSRDEGKVILDRVGAKLFDDILNRRLANGEIDTAEYEEKRKLLGR